MKSFQAGLAGFAVSVLVFYLVSIFLGGRPKNVKEFFHNKRVWLNIFSLTSGNLPLAQGVVFVLIGTQMFGILYMLLPIMLLLGQCWVYPKIISNVDERLYKRGTILAGLSDELDKISERPVRLQFFTTSYVILTYIVCLCYEVFVSSKWLAIPGRAE